MYILKKDGNFHYINTKSNNRSYITPFVTDTHLHVLGLGEKLYFPSLEGENLKEIRYIIENLLENNPKEIILRGWSEEFARPTKDFLDNITTNLPIILIRRCGHLAVVNSKALEVAVFNDSKEYIDFTTGIVKEKALEKIYQIKDFSDFSAYAEKIWGYAKDYLIGKGYGFVHSDDLHGISKEDLPFKPTDNLNVFEKVAINNHEDLIFYYENGYFDKYSCVKVYLDGSLGARTAFLLEKYNDDYNNFGIKLWEDEELIKVIDFCEKNNLHLAAHAIGDGAVEQLLNAFEKAKPKLVHRIIHAIVLNENQIERIKKLKIILDIQPQFIESDKVFIHQRLGKRLNKAFNFSKLYETGVPLFISSDAPVEEPNWVRDLKTLNNLGIPYSYSLFQITYGPEFIDNFDRELATYEQVLIFKDNPFNQISMPKVYNSK
ncbi:MAG TPA: amidohydrolase family protein [Defluviitoga sp.]|nr:amidohydrolase family protein [Defluviitoga sp.]HOP24507.1 amidohydrolase family protein [Defluviitoga sp.]HPZ29036.1 amidohydrolase family protein [Defluviitoga sp.]HQD62951.1 amidohydrolase family protein [Defluviitoga sp.]